MTVNGELKKFVLFDAFGTVVNTKEGVLDTYLATGQQYGSRLDLAQLKARFKQARREVFGVGIKADERSSRPSSDEIEKRQWQQLVELVFEQDVDTESTFNELWDYFSRPENWQAYRDVQPALRVLHDAEVACGLASNFDSRLIEVASVVLPAIPREYIFCSSLVGFRKPDPRFYQQVQDSLETKTKSALCVHMIGDDVENDVDAPRRFGWSSHAIDRRDDTASLVEIVEAIVTG